MLLLFMCERHLFGPLHYKDRINIFVQGRGLVTVKVKVKFTLEQATKAQRGCRGIAVLFL